MSDLDSPVRAESRRHQYVTNAEYFRYEGRYWRINNRYQGVFTPMLKRIIEQIVVLFSYDTKLFVARFDLHQSEATSSSKHVSEFLQRLKAELADSHCLKYLGYAWCREESDTIKQHYHLALLLEGHKIRSPHNLYAIVKDLWLAAGGISVHRGNYHNIHRHDEEGLGDIVYHLSYLAKKSGKVSLPSQFKAFSASRLKLKANKLSTYVVTR